MVEKITDQVNDLHKEVTEQAHKAAMTALERLEMDTSLGFWPALLLPGALLARQVVRLDIRDPAHCLVLFKANREVGLAVTLAFLLGRL